MKKAAPADTHNLLFAWEKPRGLFSWLPWFLFLSVAAHIGTFFLFNVVYPVRATLPPPAPQITVLSAVDPQNAALLQWIAAEDPALINSNPDLQPPNLAQALSRPSFRSIRTRPRTINDVDPVPGVPEEYPPLAIIRSTRTEPGPPAEPIRLQPSILSFSGALAERPLKEPPPFTPSKSSVPLESAKFLVGVTRDGQVRYVFIQKSSTDPGLDSQAANHLSALSFAPAKDPIMWGFANVRWGDDAYQAVASAPGTP